MTVESAKPDSYENAVFCIALPKSGSPARGKASPDWKKWQATIKKWAPGRAGAALDSAGSGLRRALESGVFDGSKGSTLLLPAGKQAWLLLVGLGDEEKVTAQTLHRAGAVAARKVISLKGHRLVSLLHEAPVEDLDEGDRLESSVQGIVLGAYKFDRFLSDGDGKKNASSDKGASKNGTDRLDVTVLARDGRAARSLEPRAQAAQVSAEGQLTARDLANLPANVATPDHLAKQARRIARDVGLSCKVMGVPELKQKKMVGLLAVGEGSSNPPRLIVLKHTPKKKGKGSYKRVVVVGKGITFDTGGISIKPSDRMELMKYDKAGACAVIGLMEAVARAQLGIEVIALAACAENMPSGSAYRPGDILTFANGKTVEVLNTDAEGRMVLADALDHAATFKPDAVIDMATLTGAIDVALGGHYSGLMSTDDALAQRIEEAGRKTGERVWRMPIGPDYQEQIKGSHSDLVNVGGRSGGASTAGQFLSNFAPDDVPWAHLDIAGTAWDEKNRPENRKGATGVGVRLMMRFLGELD